MYDYINEANEKSVTILGIHMTQELEATLVNDALNMSPVGVLIFDNDEKVQWANQAMCEFLAVPANEVIGLTTDDLRGRYLDGFDDHPDLWKVSNIVDRQNRWLVTLDHPNNHTQQQSNKILYFVDVSEIMKLKTEYRNLKDQMETNTTSDLLTGLLNKRSLLQALEPQVSRSRRYNNPLAVIILQIDGFQSQVKNVTPVTDQILTAISFYLRDQMRWVDLVGRTEDTEFTLILPETSEEDATKLALKIQSRIQNLSLPDSPDVMVSVNARFGIAAWNKGDDTNILLKKAQSRLSEDISSKEHIA